MAIKFDLIAAACENMGIGKNNNLPWRLKTEMTYFNYMTTDTMDKTKKNVVLMGRKTWDSILPKFKPLPNRINFIMSRSILNLEGYENTYGFTSLQQVVDKLLEDNFKHEYENVWVIGGSYIYEETMKSKYFHRLYLTDIKEKFDCDTFFPKISSDLVKVSDPRVPQDVQEENGIKYVFNIYENPNWNK